MKIAAFHLALPEDVLNIFATATKICSHFEDPLEPKTTETTLKRPWCGWQIMCANLQANFSLMKMNTASFETRIRITAKKTKYAEMTNSSKERMRDRLNTEVHNPTRI